MKKIGVIGARERDSASDFLQLARAFFCVYGEGDVIVSGGCLEGGDSMAEELHEMFNIPIIVHHPVLPPQHLGPKIASRPVTASQYRKAAYARNTLIARDSDVLIALVKRVRSGGTEDTIAKFVAKQSSSDRDASKLVAKGVLFILDPPEPKRRKNRRLI